MADTYLGSQLPMYQNVRIRVFDKNTGEVRLERTAKNRVTRLMLWGIARFIAGEFNNSTPDKIYEYIPRYLALGSNKPTVESQTSGVTTIVTVNDTRLLNEHTVSTSTGRTEPVKRINIEGRKHNKTATSFNEPFIKLSLSTYISSSAYNGLEIGEAGLFSKEKDNNCLARVVFSPFTKKESEVIDVQWDITMLSYGITKYPEGISIEGPNKITIPLHYTPYHIIPIDLGIYYEPESKVIYAQDYVKDSNGDILVNDAGEPVKTTTNMFVVDFDTGAISSTGYSSSLWTDEYVESLERSALGLQPDDTGSYPRNPHINNLYDIYQMLQRCKLKNNQFYLYRNADGTVIEDGPPIPFYLGEAKRVSGRENLLADSDGHLLQDSFNYQLASNDPISGTEYSQAVYMSYIYNQHVDYGHEFTGYAVVSKEGTSSKFIVDRTGGKEVETDWIITNSEIFKKDKSTESGYISTECYIIPDEALGGYIIVDKDRRAQEYRIDSSGNIQKIVKESQEEICTDAYLAWKSDAPLKDFDICKFTPYGEYIRTGYWIDWDYDKEVYNARSEEIIDTLHHVTSSSNVSDDNYFAIGDTHRLSAIITPTDSTDRSLTWSIVSDNISKINQHGVLHAWNLGETLAYVTTANNVKARTTVEVVRDATIVYTNSVSVEPDVLTFDVNTDVGKYKYIEAYIEPAVSSYNVVNWQLDSDADKLVVYESLGNNQVRVRINGTGAEGRGYITATTSDGKSAKCLIQVSISADNDTDCDDESHENQEL